MLRRPAIHALLLTALLACGCGGREPQVSREVTPSPASNRAPSPGFADPDAPTRPPRAIATH